MPLQTSEVSTNQYDMKPYLTQAYVHCVFKKIVKNCWKYCQTLFFFFFSFSKLYSSKRNAHREKFAGRSTRMHVKALGENQLAV